MSDRQLERAYNRVMDLAALLDKTPANDVDVSLQTANLWFAGELVLLDHSNPDSVKARRTQRLSVSAPQSAEDAA